MGERGATGHDDPVEPLLADLLGDVLHAVLRAGVEIRLGVGHPGQGRCVVGDFGYVEKAADVGSAVTDEHTDS